MSVDLRDYTSVNEGRLIESIYSVVSDFEELYRRYRNWSKQYGRLYSRSSNNTIVNKYYESVITFLKDAGSQFKKVYREAESAESKLSNRIKYNCNRTDMLNRKLSAYLNINRYSAVFARDDFSKIMETELSKVHDEIVIDAIDTYSQDGKWWDVLNSNDLSDEEYDALAVIYYTLDDSKKEMFVELCYKKSVESVGAIKAIKHDDLLKEIGKAPEFNQERAILYALESMSYKIEKNGEVLFFDLSKDERRFLLKLMDLYSGIDDTGYLCNGFDAWRLNHNLDDSPMGPMGIDKALIESIRKDILSGEHKLKEYEGCIPYVNRNIDYVKKVGQFRKYIPKKKMR